MRLIVAIAAGIVLGNLVWELLLEGAHLAGRIVTRTIIDAAQRAASRSQSAVTLGLERHRDDSRAVQPIASVEREESTGRNVEFLESAVRKQRAS